MDWTKYFNKDILIIDEKSYLSNLNLLTKKNYLDTLKLKEVEFQKKLSNLKKMNLIEFDYNSYNSKNSLSLLENQKDIIVTLNKYCLKLHQIDFDFIINTLNYLLQISLILKKD